MGMKFEGPVCASCQQLIEGSNFFICKQCNSAIHRTEHCMTLHMSSCNVKKPRHLNPDFDRLPDVRDIFK